VGTDEFEKAFAKQTADAIIRQLNLARDALLDVLQPIKLSERSVKQGLALMIRLCMATCAGYMVRTMPPEACRGLAAAIDTAVRQALAALMHIDLDPDVPGLNISTLETMVHLPM